MRSSGEFKLVTRRKKRATRVRTNCNLTVALPRDNENDSNRDINYESFLGRLLESEAELMNSLFGDNVLYCLKDSLTAMNVNDIPDILCYGLGHFSRNKTSKYQLALLLSLKKHYESQVYIYDPVFTSEEIDFLKRLQFNVIEVNEEGKRIIDSNVTLVYMPHCSIHLINNFLYANWCRRLTKCILLTNSFSIVTNNARETNSCSHIDYILRVRPYVTEISLLSNFVHEEAFNDLNIHIFLEQDIDTISQTFWDMHDEPCYRDAETDYLTAKQTEETDSKNSKDPRVKRQTSFQRKFSVNVWAGVIGKTLISPYYLPDNLNRDNCLAFLRNVLPNILDEVLLNGREKMKSNVKLLRSLIQEIRQASSEQNGKDHIMVQYILEQARSHRETSAVLCKAREELKNLAETYHCYLHSQRLCKEIQVRYTGKGERNIKETADLLGFKLPHDPK